MSPFDSPSVATGLSRCTEGLAEMVESCNEATPNGKLTKMKNRHMLRNCLARLLSVDEGEGSAESNVTPTAPTITSQTDDAPHEEAPADFGDLSFLLTEIEKVSIRRRKSKVPKKQDAKVAQSQSTPPPTPSATPSPAVATSVPDSAVRVASGSGLAPLREDSGLAASLPQSGTVAREGGAACGVDSRKAAAVKDTGIVAAPPAATGGSSWVVHPSRKGQHLPHARTRVTFIVWAHVWGY